MGKKKNQYEAKAKKAQILAAIKGTVNVKGNKSGTAIITVKDILLAVVGGRLVAATAGGFSIPVGVLITAAGHYYGNQNLQALGIGTMAANNQKKSDTVSGIDGLDGVKDRIKAFRTSLMEDLYVNKLLKKNTVSGIGQIQYFNYPDEAVGDLAALDNIENQLIESGMQFQGADYSSVDNFEGLADPLY